MIVSWDFSILSIFLSVRLSDCPSVSLSIPFPGLFNLSFAYCASC